MKIYKKVFQYVPDMKIVGYISVIVSGISAALTVFAYYLIYRFLREIIVVGNYEDAYYTSIKIAIALTVSFLIYLLSGIISHKVAFRLETNLRKKGIDGLMNSSFRFFDLNPSGYIRKTIDDNAEKTHMAVAHMIPDNSQAFVTPVLTLVLAFTISFRVGAVITVLSVVSAGILRAMMGNSDFMKVYQASLDRMSAETVEYIRGMQVIKIFGTKLKSFKALHESIMNYSKYAYDYTLSCKGAYVVYQWIFLGLMAILTIPLSFFLPAVVNPKFLALELIMIFFLSGVIMTSYMKIMWAAMNIFNANYAIEKLEELYEKTGEDKMSYGTISTIEDYNIEFDNVSFSYGEKKVLDNLSFSLEANRAYALVGPSGSGKSTVAKLLSGFYKIDSGSIKIGGRDISEYSKETVVKNISFVFQDSKLFKKSIYENVALADEKASKEEVMEAMKLAGCNSIIEKFKERENTIIGSKGVYLSGGEKQRIAIARAILKKSPIIIMDEASAAIDADNEYELQKAFKNLMKGKTVIMIAHRMTSIRSLDEIIVLEEGKIAERGSNDELLKLQGLYSRLSRLYESANEWRLADEKLL